MATATAEQRAAIERLRKLAAARTEIPNAAERFEEYRRIYAIPYAEDNSILNAIDSDQETVADLYLAEHPADDSEAITEDWLRSVGFARNTWHPFQLDCESDIDIRCTESDLVLGHRSDEWDVKVNPTRGDVRRLCVAFGIELTPTS